LTVMDILYTNTMYHNFDQNADSLKKIRDNISTTKTDPHYLS
ncbi:MurR/RpiR family transcriptional regulator, partial [Enterococcus gallinarum]